MQGELFNLKTSYKARECACVLRLCGLFYLQLVNSYLVYWTDENAYYDPSKAPRGCINLKRVGSRMS